MKRAFLALIASLAVTPALGQANDLQLLLSGTEFPHAMKLKALTSDWRHVAISTADKKSGGDAMKQLMQLGMMGQMGQNKGGGEAAGAMAAMSMLGGLFGGGGEDAAPSYYTQGKTTTVGGETFLVAYRLEIKAPNLMELAAKSEAEGGKEPDFAKLAADAKPTGDTDVSLTLINLKSIGTIGSIRPFDLNKELEAASKAGPGGLMDLFALGSKPEAGPVEAETVAVPAAPGIDAGVGTVELAVQTDPQLIAKGSRVQVSSANGKIVLKGTVASASLKTRAENLARKALKDAGVTASVSNQITVKK